MKLLSPHPTTVLACLLAAAVAGQNHGNESRETLKFLCSCPEPRRQITDESQFDPLKVEDEAVRGSEEDVKGPCVSG